MGNIVRKLPIGIQSFDKLRTENYLYVDKTEFIYQMAYQGVPYFLSRPRRFGKSLLLSTFKAYFEGKKELFRGLAIEKLETEWKEHPVLHFSLNAELYDSRKALENMLERQLREWEKIYDTGGEGITYSGRFMTIIRRAAEITGRKVVVLIDEYDKPLLRNLHNEELQNEFRELLTAFYTVLKDADPWLRFVFIPRCPLFPKPPPAIREKLAAIDIQGLFRGEERIVPGISHRETRDRVERASGTSFQPQRRVVR